MMFSDHSDNGCDVDEDSDHEPQNYDPISFLEVTAKCTLYFQHYNESRLPITVW